VLLGGRFSVSGFKCKILPVWVLQTALLNKLKKFMTQVGQNWNQLVRELYQWQKFGRVCEKEKGAIW